MYVLYELDLDEFGYEWHTLFPAIEQADNDIISIVGRFSSSIDFLISLKDFGKNEYFTG